jgi:hypothetical protein
MSIGYFAQLGALIASRWRSRNHEEAAFAELATAALRELPPHAHVTVEDILDAAFAGHLTAAQAAPHSAFGEPPLTLFHGERFYIDAYFWVTATTDIHQHAFSGAFSVLGGSSLHTRQAFTVEHRVNSRLLLGRLRAEASELLHVGDVRPITSGTGGSPPLIHSLFHLEAPSVTITVRTPGGENPPQYSYFPPGVALVPEPLPFPLQRRTIQLIGLLYETRSPHAAARTRQFLETADFEASLQLLRYAREKIRALRDGASWSEFLEQALTVIEQRHGALAAYLRPFFHGLERNEHLRDRRAVVRSEAHRFLLALLLNAPDRRTILELVRGRHPEQEPTALLVQWVQALLQGSPPELPGENYLGVALSEPAQVVLRAAIEGASLRETARLLERTFPGEELASDLEALQEFRDELGRSIFAPLVDLGGAAE